MPLFACYHKCFVYSFLQAYRVVLCNETIPFMLQNEHFCSHIDYILRSVIIFSLCKSIVLTIQKSLFCTAKQALLDCKNYTFATSRYSCYFFEEIFSHYEYIAVVFFFHQKKWSMFHQMRFLLPFISSFSVVGNVADSVSCSCNGKCVSLFFGSYT
ncbi:hypothetical protein HMPREF0662_02225 [Prevotella nigrescens F0103]|nr:hypothetical protein HMPREF0662_02225 [Prevotella nigrescens F0103]